jgi:glycosyltransferase involved in cell wall biosynthesis
VTVLHLVKTSVGAVWAFRQMRELVRLGVEVHVALPAGGPLIREYEESGVTMHLTQLALPTGKPWRYREVFRRLRGLVEDIRPDIIHSHFVATTLTMRLALGTGHPVPRVFQVPGPLHVEHALYRLGETRTSGPSDYWIATCRRTYDLYRRSGVPLERLSLSYVGFDLADYVGKEPGSLRRELGVGQETRLVGMVAYMYPPKYYLGQTRGLKGHEDLIDAIALCLKTNPNILGVFVGGIWGANTDYESRVRRYGAKKCGDRVVFLGTRQDVSNLYPDFEVAVHPSHSENLGGAAESLLLAVPTIATDVGGFPDIVKPEETGWLVPARNPPRLAEAILEALRDPARSKQMALRGQAVARRLLDVVENTRQVLAIYRNILTRQQVFAEP